MKLLVHLLHSASLAFSSAKRSQGNSDGLWDKIHVRLNHEELKIRFVWQKWLEMRMHFWDSPYAIVIQPQVFYVHVHLSEASLIEVQQLRVRNFQPNLEVGRELILENVNDVPEWFHLFARHNNGAGERLMWGASAWADFSPHSTMQRSAGREGKNCVKHSRHCNSARKFPSALVTSFKCLLFLSVVLLSVFNDLL